MSYLILASAIFDFAFGLFHLAFWRIFGWPASLAPSGKLNTAITQTLNLMLSYCIFAYGLGLLWLRSVDPAGADLALVGSVFWLMRAVLQLALFSRCHMSSNLFTVAFLLGAVLHAAAGVAHL